MSINQQRHCSQTRATGRRLTSSAFGTGNLGLHPNRQTVIEWAGPNILFSFILLFCRRNFNNRVSFAEMSLPLETLLHQHPKSSGLNNPRPPRLTAIPKSIRN
jgi:hypothetical protein